MKTRRVSASLINAAALIDINKLRIDCISSHGEDVVATFRPPHYTSLPFPTLILRSRRKPESRLRHSIRRRSRPRWQARLFVSITDFALFPIHVEECYSARASREQE